MAAPPETSAPCPPASPPQPRVAVIGGGVAGLSAAIHLAEKGLAVELFERFDLLGGKLKGWDTLLPGREDLGTQPMEHGMHGWWTHYHNFHRLFDRVGAHGEGRPRPAFVPVRRVWWVDALRLGAGGRGRWVVDQELLDCLFGLWNFWRLLDPRRWRVYLRILRTGLGLFGLGDSLRLLALAVALRFSWLGWLYVRLVPGARDLVAFLAPEPPERLDAKTIRELMASAPVGERISQFFDVLTGMGTYGRPAEQSAYHVSRLLDFYVLRTPRAIWFEMCPDSSHADAVWPLIDQARKVGVRVRTHAPAKRLARHGQRWRVEIDGDRRRGSRGFDHVVLALDISGARRLLSASGSPELAALAESVSRQALNRVMVVRIWFRNSIDDATDPPYALALSAAEAAGCPFDFVFVPSRYQERPRKAGGEVVEFHISYWERFEHEQAKIVDLVLEWALRLFPELDHPDGVAHTAISTVNNYSRVPPRHLGHAPQTSGAAESVYLCGDWIRWPTPVMYMEKALVTGMAVAGEICRREGLEPPEILSLPAPAPLQRAAQRLTDGSD